MRKTKCLFPDGASPEGMVSVSQLQTFMSCPQKWEYGYIDEITPRVERPYLSVGKLCHKGMETAMRYKWKYERGQGWCRENALNMALLAMEDEWDEYINNTPFTNEELSEQMQVYWDAVEVFCQAFWEFDIDKYDVVTLRGADGDIPALELHFLVPCPGSKGLHGYIDAILKERSTGMVWCTDYKFRKSLSPDEEEAFNIQNAVYQHACSRMGINITGTMTWQHVNTPDGLGTVLEVNPVSGYLRVRCGTESLAPRYYKVGVCEYVSGGKRPPRRPDPDDDYSGVRNPAPVVASSDDEKRPACPRRRASEKE